MQRSRWQRAVVALVIVVTMIAVFVTGLGYIGQGIGGVVPYLMMAVAPLLAGYYVWYLLIRRTQ